MSTRIFIQFAITLLCFFQLARPGYAHDGHRFLVKVSDGKLIAQGVNTEKPTRFNEAAVRPYVNVIHDNWTNYGFNGVDTAVALLPGFDLPASESELWYSTLTLTVDDIYRWDDVPESPSSETTVELMAPVTEVFTLGYGKNNISTASGLPGVITLAQNVPRTGIADLDLGYRLNKHVKDSIYVIRMKLSSDAVNVADSDPVYVILGPPGYKYHSTLIYLEKYLSINTPQIIHRPGLTADDVSLNSFIGDNIILLLVITVMLLPVAILLIARYRSRNH